MADGTIVSFPGLGIGEIKLNPVAISNAFGVEGLDIRWYALIICTGIICAFAYFLRRGKRTEMLLEDDLLNVALFAVPIGVVGARFLYVITNLETYDGFKEMINIRNGGLAIYGGIIFGALTIFVYSCIKKQNPLKYYDAICPGVMLAQAIGRWGNFMNGEAYGVGYGAEKMPWRMVVQKYELVDGVAETGGYLQKVTHPTFLYESLWNLLGFVIANILYKNKKFDGRIFTFYVAWYGFGRAWIEFLRHDSLMIGNQKLMVYLGFLTCAAAVAAHIYLYKRNDKEIEAYKQSKTLTEETANDNT
ncbi:MAG: prolipoprotein diacylglyceryl transferase [Ruminococcaceae bacterium]|nr:prolipoprotein diacylglyceryl transferase [Oscillospiraceae bacterium]